MPKNYIQGFRNKADNWFIQCALKKLCNLKPVTQLHVWCNLKPVTQLHVWCNLKPVTQLHNWCNLKPVTQLHVWCNLKPVTQLHNWCNLKPVTQLHVWCNLKPVTKLHVCTTQSVMPLFLSTHFVCFHLNDSLIYTLHFIYIHMIQTYNIVTAVLENKYYGNVIYVKWIKVTNKYGLRSSKCQLFEVCMMWRERQQCFYMSILGLWTFDHNSRTFLYV